MLIVDTEKYEVIEKPSYRKKRLEHEKTKHEEWLEFYEYEIQRRKERIAEIDKELKGVKNKKGA